ncbi:hypothetical protein TNCT_170451 [Trichonephila clavata]|uniref:Uncharacterized protein n=1 Tax=Trichonephila clavata TaxID=2740835 RepID=A0A8X6KF41_TRICU|nr:hypothetical protein TNCT_170451 [Trichonephila clavata]
MELEPDRVNLNKRKDNDDGFISPPSRKKQTKLNSPPSKLNFEIELSNKFEKLGKETAGTLTTDDTPNNDKTTPMPKYLPPPCNDESYHHLQGSNEGTY